ncbi:DUF1413 domain-containing protein [Staphylococcus auricularis]|uniref:DUF1413 domain-containing protein n=1 Tax=Staphylococcus auricularis TaxID=29379 RepID=A0ABX5ICJ6_9STAP|nr:DUF1413 domain-containing protein [Staphylococcus auricularis]MCE5038527.1 DUF1413 domain-containing protein [Staphylococcus auricularis]MEB6570231.1 single-stranded DNA-binding protein [Staphylococcus auricularis]PTH14845.1 hypothetical protein BU607_09090 [Staphylococcus auricularis]PTH24824.1 hypothetical protein BU608_09495 [Staphylococcus auricularis]
MKDFEQRVEALRQQKARTSFDFHFDELYSEDEWLSISMKEQKDLERAFRSYVDKCSQIRIPAESKDKIRFRIFNTLYSYNEVKKNFKQYVI